MIARRLESSARLVIGLLVSDLAAAAVELPPEDVLLALRQARTHQTAGSVAEERAVNDSTQPAQGGGLGPAHGAATRGSDAARTREARGQRSQRRDALALPSRRPAIR